MTTSRITWVERIARDIHDAVLRLERANRTSEALSFSLQLYRANGDIRELLKIEEALKPILQELDEVHSYAGEVWRPRYTHDPQRGTFVEIVRVDSEGQEISHKAWGPRFYKRRSHAEHKAAVFLGKVCGQ